MPLIINIKRIVSIIVLSAFVSQGLILPKAQAQSVSELPVPGTMVTLSNTFEPILIKGLKVHPENPFLLDFILDTGHSGYSPDNKDLQMETNRLIKYFLASMTIPEKDLWVNLSPYEKDRIIAPNLGETEMGRDMLAQDYILKQLTASLINPNKSLGRSFWDRIYSKAMELYGTTDIPINTFNKVWIVADQADVLERNHAAYVMKAHLKVMLEEDYLSKIKHIEAKSSGGLASQIIREVILPELDKEINSGKSFAPLRQMYYSMILASWYKLRLKDALLNQIYSNQSKVKAGVNVIDPTERQKIFDRYLEAYKKGVFNFIKDDIDRYSAQKTARKYFSGGLEMNVDHAMKIYRDVPRDFSTPSSTGNTLEATIQLNMSGTNSEHSRLWNVRKEALSRDPDLNQLPAEVHKALKDYFDAVERLSTTEHWSIETVKNERQALIKAFQTARLERVEAFLKFNNTVLYMPVNAEIHRLEKEAFLKVEWPAEYHQDQAMIGDPSFIQFQGRTIYRFGWLKKLSPAEAEDQTKRFLSEKSPDKNKFSSSEVFDVYFRLSSGAPEQGYAVYDLYVKPSEFNKPKNQIDQSFYKGFVKLSFEKGKLTKWETPDISPRRQADFPWLNDHVQSKLNDLKGRVFTLDEQASDEAMTVKDYQKNPQKFMLQVTKDSLRIGSNSLVRLTASRTVLNHPDVFNRQDRSLALEAVDHALRYPDSTVDDSIILAIEIVLSHRGASEFKEMIPLAVANLQKIIGPAGDKTSTSSKAALLILRNSKRAELKDLIPQAEAKVRNSLTRHDLDGLISAAAVIRSNAPSLTPLLPQAKQIVDDQLTTTRDPRLLNGPNLLWTLEIIDTALKQWKQWSIAKDIKKKEWVAGIIQSMMIFREELRVDPFLKASASDLYLTYALSDQAMESTGSENALTLFQSASVPAEMISILEPEVVDEASIPSLDIQFASAPEEAPITDYVSADPMFGGGFQKEEIFNRYKSTLQKEKSPLFQDILNRFLQSKYGHRLRKALSKIGIKNITADVIPMEIWDDYDYAFAVRHVIHQGDQLYVAVNAGVSTHNPVLGLLQMINAIASTKWGNDVLTTEGLVTKSKEDLIPVLSEPSLPAYFVLMQLLKEVRILPGEASDKLEKEAYPYQEELKSRMKVGADIHQLAQLLWDQLPEEGGSLPGAIYMRDKKTYTEIDISANDESPDFRLKNSDIRKYIEDLQKPGAYRLVYTHRRSRGQSNAPFIDIDLNALFGDLLKKLLTEDGLDDAALKDRVRGIERKVMGMHELISRLITRAAENDILTFENGAMFKAEQTPQQRPLLEYKDEAMGSRRELRNGGQATDEEVTDVLVVLNKIAEVDKKEHGEFTPLLEETFQIARRPAYIPTPWNEEKLKQIEGFDRLFAGNHRDIILSVMDGTTLQREMGPAFKEEGPIKQGVTIVSVSATHVNSFLKSQLERNGAGDFVQRLTNHAEHYASAVQRLGKANARESSNIVDELDQLDNFEADIIKTAKKNHHLAIEFNKNLVLWSNSDQAMSSDSDEAKLNDMAETGRELTRLKEYLEVVKDELRPDPSNPQVLAKKKQTEEDISTLQERLRRLGLTPIDDQAMKVKDNSLKGGIDFDAAKMTLNLRKEGEGVLLNFDPVLVRKIKESGFEGLEFKIQSIQAVSNLPLLLDL